MSLEELERLLYTVKENRMIMYNPSSGSAVSSLLAVVNSVRTLQGVLSSDPMGGMMMPKVMELEMTIGQFGMQKLMSVGVDVNSMGMNPMGGMGINQMNGMNMGMPQMGGMNQMGMGMNPMNGMNMGMPQPQMLSSWQAAPQQPMQSQMQQPMAQPQAAPAVPAPSAPVQTLENKPRGSGATMSLPGMDDGKPAAGRDYLLKLLGE